MKTSTKVFIVIAIVIIVISSMRLVQNIRSGGLPAEEVVTEDVLVQNIAPETPPTFAWSFVYDDANSDALPRSAITLSTTYESGKTARTAIRSVEGSCNEVDKKPIVDADMVTGSAKIQCYAAGFGDRFKIVQGENSYEVLHQEFGEASPDYQLPDQPYTVIATIAFQ